MLIRSLVPSIVSSFVLNGFSCAFVRVRVCCLLVRPHVLSWFVFFGSVIVVAVPLISCCVSLVVFIGVLEDFVSGTRGRWLKGLSYVYICACRQIFRHASPVLILALRFLWSSFFLQKGPSFSRIRYATIRAQKTCCAFKGYSADYVENPGRDHDV